MRASTPRFAAGKNHFAQCERSARMGGERIFEIVSYTDRVMLARIDGF
jgi:hypothetical protein